ncbi:hypothetical protein [Actinoplanes sp. G11-F43]|uniref:hypothetical protein n=1 Tax=Actinoplanes sp. G11-F43 TaxID=3424130 RepID=UPI003D3505B3
MSGEQEIESLYAVARAGDVPGFQHGVPALWTAIEGVTGAEAAGILDRLTGLFGLVPRLASAHLAIVCGALVEKGAPAGAFPAIVADALADVLAGATAFVAAWRRPLPDVDGDQRQYDAAVAVLTHSGRWPWQRGLSPDRAAELAGSWFALHDWRVPASALLHSGGIRAGFPRRAELLTLVRGLRAHRDDLRELYDMLAVLDGETVTVLHREQRRGYRVRITGVADNFQLYTLLADTLIGDPASGLLDGENPEPDWVYAATTGPCELPVRIEARFQITDGDGMYVPLEGRPSDIPPFRGRRLLVLDRPSPGRSWDVGRRHDGTDARITVEEILDQAGTDRLLHQVAGRIHTGETHSHIHLGLRAGVVEVTG